MAGAFQKHDLVLGLKRVAHALGIYGDKTARRAIDLALEMGIIKKNEADIYYLVELWKEEDLPY
jgi:hypothetical protein